METEPYHGKGNMTLRSIWTSRWFKAITAILLAVVISLAPMSDAWARSGGRIGGGSFRAPRAPRSAPGPRGGGGGFFPGGGFGFPFFFPLFFGGGGGVITLLLVLGAGSFLLRTLRSGNDQNTGGYDDQGYYKPSADPKVQLAEIKVGLLSSARSLQHEIDDLARSANTGEAKGLSQLLQNVTLSLVRHDEYWVYGQTESRQTSMSEAEQIFYQNSLRERSKYSAETLTNVDQQRGQLSGESNGAQTGDAITETEDQGTGEYIVVTLLVASHSRSGTLPAVDSATTLRKVLMQLGALPAERIVAVEVLWTPQQEGDTLSSEEMLVEYPQLRRL